MHAEVALRVKVAIGELTSLTPILQRLALFVVEQSHDSFLVKDVCLLADKGSLHLVDWLLEELFVLSDQEFFDALQASFPLGDRVDLDAFDKHLDQRSRLREFGPSQGQGVERDAKVLLGCPADHQLKNRDSKRVDVFEHDDLTFLILCNLLLLLREWPVAGLSAQRHLHGGLRGEVGDFVDYVVVFLLEDHFAQVELPVDETRVVGEVEALGQLDGHVVDHLDVGARHVDRKVQVQALDMLEDVSAVIGLDHGEVSAAHHVGETVEGRDDVRVSLQLDPLCDVFGVGHLPDDELLTEVFVVDHEGRVANHVFDLIKSIRSISAVPMHAFKTKFEMEPQLTTALPLRMR